MVAALDRGLENYAQVLLAATGQDVTAMVGGGAAGGMGAAARVFLNATLKSGIDIVLEAVHLEEARAMRTGDHRRRANGFANRRR